MRTTALLLMTLVMNAVSAQPKSKTGYAPVNAIEMYYEVHGSGASVVLIHGAFMTITNNWSGWIGELCKTRKVIAIKMQGHGGLEFLRFRSGQAEGDQTSHVFHPRR